MKWILGAALAGFLALQLIRPGLPSMPADGSRDLLSGSSAPPAEIAGMLRQACYDCHSAGTAWPWYSKVAPVSWWVAAHVRDGRERLDFSNWPVEDAERARRRWNRIAEEVEYGTMPLPSYTWMHRESRLTPSQRAQIVSWAGEESQRLKQMLHEADADAKPDGGGAD